MQTKKRKSSAAAFAARRDGATSPPAHNNNTNTNHVTNNQPQAVSFSQRELTDAPAEPAVPHPVQGLFCDDSLVGLDAIGIHPQDVVATAGNTMAERVAALESQVRALIHTNTTMHNQVSTLQAQVSQLSHTVDILRWRAQAGVFSSHQKVWQVSIAEKDALLADHQTLFNGINQDQDQPLPQRYMQIWNTNEQLRNFFTGHAFVLGENASNNTIYFSLRRAQALEFLTMLLKSAEASRLLIAYDIIQSNDEVYMSLFNPSKLLLICHNEPLLTFSDAAEPELFKLLMINSCKCPALELMLFNACKSNPQITSWLVRASSLISDNPQAQHIKFFIGDKTLYFDAELTEALTRILDLYKSTLNHLISRMQPTLHGITPAASMHMQPATTSPNLCFNSAGPLQSFTSRR